MLIAIDLTLVVQYFTSTFPLELISLVLYLCTSLSSYTSYTTMGVFKLTRS